MGIGKKKKSAGQKALDLTKQMSRLEDLGLQGVMQLTSVDLKKRGVPIAERKRLLRFCDKVKQGYKHHGREGDWKAWRPPALDSCPP